VDMLDVTRERGTTTTGEVEAVPGLSAVVVPLAAVQPTGPEAAALESGVRSHTRTGHCDRASRAAPCRRVRRAVRAGRGFRTGIPFLRLLLGSKGGEVVELVVVSSHDMPPFVTHRRVEYPRLEEPSPLERRPTMSCRRTRHGNAASLATELSVRRRCGRATGWADAGVLAIGVANRAAECRGAGVEKHALGRTALPSGSCAVIG
jgi:hypothetical protein